MRVFLAILFVVAPLLSSFGSGEGAWAMTEGAAASCCHAPVEASSSEDDRCCCRDPGDGEPCSTEGRACGSDECECRSVTAVGFAAVPVESDAFSLGTAGGKLPFPRVQPPYNVSLSALGKVPKG